MELKGNSLDAPRLYKPSSSDTYHKISLFVQRNNTDPIIVFCYILGQNCHQQQCFNTDESSRDEMKEVLIWITVFGDTNKGCDKEILKHSDSK